MKMMMRANHDVLSGAHIAYLPLHTPNMQVVALPPPLFPAPHTICNHTPLRSTLGSKYANMSSLSGVAAPPMSCSTATVTAACCSPANRFFTPVVQDDTHEVYKFKRIDLLWLVALRTSYHPSPLHTQGTQDYTPNPSRHTTHQHPPFVKEPSPCPNVLSAQLSKLLLCELRAPSPSA